LKLRIGGQRGCEGEQVCNLRAVSAGDLALTLAAALHREMPHSSGAFDHDLKVSRARRGAQAREQRRKRHKLKGSRLR
jgi:hypothetical protein